jgi:phospholipid/cholesterol/gamma-HCH transport system substrate-binding protein
MTPSIDLIKKFLIPGVILALVAAFAVSLLTGGKDSKTLTATFPRTVSLYEGSDVRVLGVPIGKVETVTPQATDVKVTMSYDANVRLPENAEAVIISPSVVGDRFVQITPVYQDGASLADGAKLDMSQTSTPLELDEIYGSLDQLTVALGPDGANKDGALSALLDSAAKNWGGQGEQFHQTIGDISKLTGTLDDNKEELFGTAAKLESFISTLAKNDKTVRNFNQSISQVSTMLAGERDELSASLRNVAIAMGQVSGFVKENREILGTNIKGLNRVAKILVKQRTALDEILKVAPVALANLSLTYNPQAGTLDTRANLGELINQVTSDPATLLCGLVNQADQNGQICGLIQDALPRPGAFSDGSPQRSSGPKFDPSLGGLVEVSQ